MIDIEELFLEVASEVYGELKGGAVIRMREFAKKVGERLKYADKEQCPRCLKVLGHSVHTCTPTPFVGELEARIAELEACAIKQDPNKCPQCGGFADNGFDRCYPPNPYLCSKCIPTE